VLPGSLLGLASFRPFEFLEVFAGGMVIVLFSDWFFLADILVQGLTGVKQEASDRVDYRFASMMRSYLTGWFWLDAVACVPFDCIWIRFSGALQTQPAVKPIVVGCNMAQLASMLSCS